MVCFSPISRNHEAILTQSTSLTPFVPPAWMNQVHALILDWYARVGRDLPWRRTRDPYAIMISEIMLQQTQVDRVLPKYAEPLSRFPRMEDLARASLAEILRAWSPLGYNRRARYLHQACGVIVTTFGGVFLVISRSCDRFPVSVDTRPQPSPASPSNRLCQLWIQMFDEF